MAGRESAGQAPESPCPPPGPGRTMHTLPGGTGPHRPKFTTQPRYPSPQPKAQRSANQAREATATERQQIRTGPVASADRIIRAGLTRDVVVRSGPLVPAAGTLPAVRPE